MPKIRQLDDPKSAARLFNELARTAQLIRIATAWASPDAPVISSLEKAQADGKLELVVGWDFEGTHPKFLRKFRESLRVKPRSFGSTFHPKAYLFMTGKSFDAIVGSSNLTHGGFDGNVELNLHLSGATDEPCYKDLNNYVQKQWESAREVSEGDIEEYDRRWRKSKTKGGPVIPPPPSSNVARSKPQIVVDARLDVDFAGFVRLLRRVDGRKHHVFHKADRESYLDVIADVQEYFARKGSLENMSREERSNVGGTNTHSRFGYFGTTQSVGSFTHAVIASPAMIDRALDQVPFGTNSRVSKAEFDSFFAEFQRFAHSFRRPRPSVGCASRLLAMKRPDTFVCVNGQNRGRMAIAFGLSETELRSARGYWRLCEHLWSLPWYESPQPRTGDELPIWKARVALVDAFYYPG